MAGCLAVKSACWCQIIRVCTALVGAYHVVMDLHASTWYKQWLTVAQDKLDGVEAATTYEGQSYQS